MRFYLVPAAAGLPRQLFHTKHAFGAEAKARGLKILAEDHVEEIPTHSAGLQDYLNNLFAQEAAQAQFERGPDIPPHIVETTTVADRKPTWAERPEPRLFPGETDVDKFCDRIGDMSARDLSNVAEAVAFRFQQIAKEAKA